MIEIAHSMSVPVIVDAAAQIPPISNLWHYTRDLGADAAIFSGGKGLQGPQTTAWWLPEGDHRRDTPERGRPVRASGAR
ncbi:MAG: hypothetical protein R2848_02585 [Thermomicrobiales bacterium]